MSETLKIALVRALIGGFVMAGTAFFTQLTTGGSLHVAEIAAGSAFFLYLVLRGGAEGFLDNANSSKPNP